MKRVIILTITCFLASCAPTTAKPSPSFDLLKSKTAPLLTVRDASGKEMLKFSHLPTDVHVVDGLALYDSAVNPGFNTMTSVKPNQVVTIVDPSKALNPSGEKPAYELLLCVAQSKSEGIYEGTSYNLEKTDRTALLAILTGVNQGRDGADDMLRQGLKDMKPLGTCEINVNYMM